MSTRRYPVRFSGRARRAIKDATTRNSLQPVRFATYKKTEVV